jgi:hypothetical protein
MKYRFTSIAALLLSACSTAPVLQPDVSGGAIAAHGGVVYSIPPQANDQSNRATPFYKMKLVSLGVNEKKMLHLRIYFQRVGDPAKGYIDPSEQAVIFPDTNQEVHPAKVHANSVHKPWIDLDEPAKQVVELLFPLPEGGHDFPHLRLHWKVHYQIAGHDQIMDKFEVYHLVDKYAQNGVGNYSGDLEFPDSEPWMMPAYTEWIGPGWMWW